MRAVRLEPPERLLAGILDGVASERLRAAPDYAACAAELQHRGYPLDATLRLPAAGWFHPGRVRIDGDFGQRLQVWCRVGSTNDLAHAGEPVAPGTVWVTEEQTGGRGRHGRRWQAPPYEGLLFSLRLPPPSPQAALPQLLPLALALGACEAVRTATRCDVQLKWPNDLLLGGGKLGGMLLEVRGTGAVVGVGINVHGSAVDLERRGIPGAACLAEPVGDTAGGERLQRETLLGAVLAGMETRFATWQQGGADEVLAAWRRLDALLGRRVRIAAASLRFDADVVGIDADGLLRVHADRIGERSFAAAEVHLL